jgi:hypothetical protein
MIIMLSREVEPSADDKRLTLKLAKNCELVGTMDDPIDCLLS